MTTLSCILFLIAAAVASSLPMHQPKKPILADMPQKIVELIEFSSPSTGEIAEFVPIPYEFGYEFGDGLGMKQHHSQSLGEDGIVKGSYGYVDPLGVYRNVEYTADAGGYRAVIRTNEPGAAAKDIADGQYIVETPPAAAWVQGQVFEGDGGNNF